MTAGLPDPGELATPAGTARLLRAFGIRPRKRFGQHFLVSRRVLDRIIEEAAPAVEEPVLEVGPGLGTLTVALAGRGAAVTAVEIDPRLMPVLRAVTAAFPQVRLVHGDVMAMDLRALPGGEPAKLVAALPYNIASPLIVRCLETLREMRRLVVTVQAEVADRLTARPGTKAYGSLTVAVAYRGEAARVMRVAPGAFLPPPEVASAVIRIDVSGRRAARVQDEALFFRVVRAAFAQRRKMLRNTLAAGLRLPASSAEAACGRAGIDPRRRGETLTVEEFAALAEAVHAEVGSEGRPPAG